MLFAYPRNKVIEASAEIDIRPIIVRQERIAVHMADAVARLSHGKKIGVFACQHGPGIENAYGSVAQAYSESIPLLILPGGYATRIAHVPDNFNSTVVLAHVAKHTEPITSGAEVPNIMRRAFSMLRNGRRRPVVVEIPNDLYMAEVPEPLDYEPVYSTRSGPDPADVKRAARVLVDAKRLVIYAGAGIHWAEAYAELKELAELLGAPVCTSLEGKSAFDETHPLALGAGGAAMPKTIKHFLDNADVVFGAGVSFSESSFAIKMPKNKTYVHLTDDGNDLNKSVRSVAGMTGDAQLGLRALIDACKALLDGTHSDPLRAHAEIAEVESAWLAEWLPKLTSNDAPLSPYRVLWDLQHTVDKANTIITHDAGSPRDQLTPFWKSTAPLSYLGWGKTTQLGYGPGTRDGREARVSGQALHQRVGRRRDRLHRHGLRNGRARADSDSLDSAEQFGDGDRTRRDAGRDAEVPLDRYLRRLRRDGACVRRLRRARDQAGRHHSRDQTRHRTNAERRARAARVHHRARDESVALLMRARATAAVTALAVALGVAAPLRASAEALTPMNPGFHQTLACDGGGSIDIRVATTRLELAPEATLVSTTLSLGGSRVKTDALRSADASGNIYAIGYAFPQFVKRFPKRLLLPASPPPPGQRDDVLQRRRRKGRQTLRRREDAARTGNVRRASGHRLRVLRLSRQTQAQHGDVPARRRRHERRLRGARRRPYRPLMPRARLLRR